MNRLIKEKYKLKQKYQFVTTENSIIMCDVTATEWPSTFLMKHIRGKVALRAQTPGWKHELVCYKYRSIRLLVNTWKSALSFAAGTVNAGKDTTDWPKGGMIGIFLFHSVFVGFWHVRTFLSRHVCTNPNQENERVSTN